MDEELFFGLKLKQLAAMTLGTYSVLWLVEILGV